MANPFAQTISDAAQAYGANPGVLSRIAQLESGFNAGAQNNWDSNARRGTPSAGLFQFIQPTFNAFSREARAANPNAWQGVSGNWLDPHAQALTTAWAITHGHGGDWATYHRALAGSERGGVPQSSAVQSLASPVSGSGLAGKLGVLAGLFGQSDPWLSQLFASKAATLGVPAAVGAPSGGSSPSIIPSSSGGNAAPVSFGGHLVAPWIAPILSWAQQHGWQGSITSGYRSPAEQASLYANRGSNPNPVGQHSNHEFTTFPGGAVDVSNAQQLSQILAGSPFAGKLVWAGSKDPVHFSHPHGGSY